MSEDQVEGALKKGVGHVQDAVGGFVGDDKTQAKGKLNEAKGSIQDTYGKVVDQAQDVYSQARDQARDTYGDVESYLSDQPLVALGAGVAVGLLLGLMLRGGRRD